MLIASLLLNVILFSALVLQAGEKGYHKGLCDKDVSGWEDEAKFWRNIYAPEAETKRINDENN